MTHQWLYFSLRVMAGGTDYNKTDFFFPFLPQTQES